MKNNPGKKVTLIMVMVLILTSLLWLQGESDAFAATPSFKETKVEIIGEGETYQLDIKNKVDGSKYKWSSTNTKVARVSSKGLVTSVGKGSATIRCIITYPTNKTKTLNCKVTVIIPATKIKINNAKEVNGAHILQLGESYNFNRDLVPAGSSDKTYWSIGGGDSACIEITNSSSGIVKATKPGKVILVATAARKSTAADAAKSIVNDAIIIEVVGPSATVASADIVGSTEIKAVFDSPIDASTVIGKNNALLDSIELSLRKNIKGVMAADPGKLTAQLSADNKTLTITSENRFEGEYVINFTNKIKTTDGVAIEEYYKYISYVDNEAPEVRSVTLDDSGMISTITFSEPIDFSGFNVSNASLVAGTSTSSADPTTISFLNNKSNYIPSDDKKSLTINLSNIAYTDINKIFAVTLSGIKDMAGNMPKNYTITITLRTDNTPKPQAKLLTVLRTGYYTLTATFDRSIQFGGYASLEFGSTMMGEVDSKNPKMVHYTLNEVDAQKTGRQTVTITGWDGYNVDPKDTSAYQPNSRTVNFDVEKTGPNLIKQEFDPATNILTLTYNKDVSLNSNTGMFTASIVTISEEIMQTSITYTGLASNDPKELKLKLGNMPYIGTYTFTLDQYFVVDNFRNYGIARTVSINNAVGQDIELPGPYMAAQSTTNLSQIYLEFEYRLDVASAQDIRNYTIPGVQIISAQVIKNTNDSGATVVLTVTEGAIDISLPRPIIINGVKSYSGNFAPITDFEIIVDLKDNKRPTFISPVTFDRTKTDEIVLRFSENIAGTMEVKVTNVQYNYEIGNTVTIEGNNVIIKLDYPPERNTELRINILRNEIVDLSGNQVGPMASQYTVVAAY